MPMSVEFPLNMLEAAASNERRRLHRQSIHAGAGETICHTPRWERGPERKG
jgi:hypothetical protein